MNSRTTLESNKRWQLDGQGIATVAMACPSVVHRPGEDSMLEIGSEHRLRSENLPFDIDVWYPRIRQFTPRTVFLPLDREEAVALMNAYQQFCGRDHLRLCDLDVLSNLENRIKTAVDENFSSTGAFLRLCGRSPKDAEPADPEALKAAYQAALSAIMDEELGPERSKDSIATASMKLKAIAKVSWLKVTSGREAMNLLVTSERLFTDLHDWLKWGEPEQVVLREWVPDMRLDFEFRAYVSKGRMTCLSQYDHYGVYEHLFPLKDKLQSMIVAQWEEVHPLVGLDSYCMDFAYLPASDTVIVIEMSPLLPCTGAALFNWTLDHQQLHNGDILEFRLKETLRPELDDLLEMNWDLRWRDAKSWQYDHIVTRAIDNCLGVDGVQSPPPGALQRVWKTFNRALSSTKTRHVRIFVYGTLKRNFYWSHKYLFSSRYLGKATTVHPHALVIGDCGVPYLLGDVEGDAENHCIEGEVWEVSSVTLQNLDEYEGVGKGYYSRKEIPVVNSDGKACTAEIYFLKTSTEELRGKERLKEYSKEVHDIHYNAMRHILIKQELYLQGEASTTSS